MTFSVLLDLLSDVHHGCGLLFSIVTLSDTGLSTSNLASYMGDSIIIEQPQNGLTVPRPF